MTPRTKPLPKMFVGSSSEKLSIVDVLVQAFSRHVQSIPWRLAPEFSTRGSFTTFNALCDAARAYDFALFVLTADDILQHRGEECSCPRDNVVFEMGLFIGTIGAERVFAVVEGDTDMPMKIPSDLVSVNMPRFTYNEADLHSTIASINAEIQGFVTTIKRHGFHRIDLNLAVGWKCLLPGPFDVKLGAGQLAAAKSTIGNRAIAIAARVDDPVVNFEDDDSVVYSDPRTLPEPLGDMIFRIPIDGFKKEVHVGAKVQGRILLVPPTLELQNFRTLKDAVAYGCRIVEPIFVLARTNDEGS